VVINRSIFFYNRSMDMEMDKDKRKQILLTNDDGIDSPGLWAAAQALSRLGFVTVAAPREQESATGRSMPNDSDGRITVRVMQIGSQEWPVHSVGGTPAQVVQHAIMEIMPQKPDLVVSGINYGENLGNSITVSGTVGAAMEGADFGIPSIAASLELLNIDEYRSNSALIDFSTAAHFTYCLAKWMLEQGLPKGIDLLKLDVPHDATPETPWRITSLGQHRYYLPILERQGGWEDPAFISGKPLNQFEGVRQDSDIYTVKHDRMVAITPLTLDMTARVSFKKLEEKFKTRVMC